MAARPPGQPPSMEVFDTYFKRADLDMDGRISGAEAVAFLQGSNLPRQVLAQIWMYSDSSKAGFLNRQEFYNALRLVTVAQSGRQLTPEIVKAALEGPAAAKIPAPMINPVAASGSGNQIFGQRPQVQSMAVPQIGTMTSALSQPYGFKGSQGLPNANVSQQFFSSTAGQQSRPNQGDPVVSSRSLVNQGIPGGGMVAAPRLPNSSSPNLSTDWFNGRGGTPHVPSASSPTVVQDGFGPVQAGPTSTNHHTPLTADATSLLQKPRDPQLSYQPSTRDPRPSAVSANGFSSGSLFGGDMFSAASHPKQSASAATSAVNSIPNTSGVISTTSGFQPSASHGQNISSHSSSVMNLGGSQAQQAQLFVKQSLPEMVQSNLASKQSAISVVTTTPPTISERPWPKFTPSSIRKYSKVFVEVDKDRDGKISGEQARELFLSWRLPREILKQVWDLSDQDNDSMLSHREFVTALYLMERYREGYTLPAALPNNVKFDETLLQATGQSPISYGGVAWQHPGPGFTQQRMHVPRPSIPSSRLKLQGQVKEPQQVDGQMQPVQQKSSIPVLEKHLVNQLSKEEQDSLNSKFQEANDADKKVQELEKEILDSREKIEFYRTKMQELVLYKSRCDNRLNEITEKTSANKHEVDLLAKKYEDKYKQAGDVASKLTVEEATFRDIQERKLELYHAIIKMEQDGTADGVLQVRADKIQSDIEELVKVLNERCKQYGLRAKPTTLVELPFGWQPGIQESAADWDEDWDKFEDEGFAIVKELTVDVQNMIAPPKAKPCSGETVETAKEKASSVVSPLNDDAGTSGLPEHISGGERAYVQSEDGSLRSPPGSPPGRSSVESPKDFRSSLTVHGTSPRLKETKSDYDGAESTTSGDKFVDEPHWGATFDTNDDAESIWDFNSTESNYGKHNSFFDSGDFSLKPIRTDSPSAASVFGKKERSPFFDSGDFGLNPIRMDSPSAASVFGKKDKSPFFADSVPGTPLFNSSFSPRFNEGSDDRSFDSFSRFDSFSMHDGGPFQPRDTLARFDSMRSTSDQSGFIPPPEHFTRFDSFRTTSDHSRIYSFDDSDPDPFGSSGPFKSTESNTPKRGTDNWSAF